MDVSSIDVYICGIHVDICSIPADIGNIHVAVTGYIFEMSQRFLRAAALPD
jgi:hypothetical protein